MISKVAKQKAKKIEFEKQYEQYKKEEREKDIAFMEKYGICCKCGEKLEMKYDEPSILLEIIAFLFRAPSIKEGRYKCKKCGEGYTPNMCYHGYY